MNTSNPAFKEKIYDNAASQGIRGETMTLEGTSVKAGILGLICVASAAWPWHVFFSSTAELSTSAMMPYLLIGGIGGFIFALITIFKNQAAPITAPLYAALEGLAIGAVSVLYEYQYPGIGIQAIGLTFGVLAVMLVGYQTKLMKPSAGFMKGVMIATGGIAVYYLVAMGLSFFGIHAPMIWDSGPIGIGFSLLVTGLAALNLLLDFNFIEQNVEKGAPKYMEWYSAFGLMLTVVWLYFELLRLLSKLNKR